MPPAPHLPPALHRVLSIFLRLASPRHLLQAHAFLLPRGGHHHRRLLSALLLASLRLAPRSRHAHATTLLRHVHPSVSLRAAAGLPPRLLRGSLLVPQLHSLLLRTGLATSDAHVSASLVQAYCACGHVAAARSVFDEMAVRNVVSWNVMIAGYVKAGDLATAQELFDVMPKRNVVSWTTLIGAYAQMRRPEEAVEVFRRMQLEEGIEPDGVALLSVLSACGDLGEVDLGDWVHRFVVRRGLCQKIPLMNAIIDMYMKCGCIEKAVEVFEGIEDKSVVTWTTIIAGYVKAGDLATAKELFDVMPKRNVVSWTTLIRAYVQMRRPEEAVEVFRRMQLEGGIEPDGVALLSVLSACGHLVAVDLGEWVHRFVVMRGLCQKIPLMTAIIDMYMKCGCIQKAVEVFEGMEEKSVVTWTTLIAGFALHGLGLQAVEMFRRMEWENVAPDDVTFLAILSACSHVGLTDLGCWYFNTMVSRYRIKPLVEHYGCMVDLLCRAGCLEEAQDLVKDMPFKGNAVIWGALLAAARTHGDAVLGEQALSHLIELEPHNSGNYILLSNIFAEQERWDDMSKLRKAIKERGLRIVLGASSIKVDGMVHEFTSRGGSHSSLHKIHEVLCEMNT